MSTRKTKIQDLDNGWKEFTVDGHRVVAKVYDEPSEFGIRNGRISKLWIQNKKTKEVVFNWDRGLDFNRAPLGLLEKIQIMETQGEI